MPEQVTATLNGQAMIELRIELLRGGGPSRFEATLPPSANLQSGPAVLHVADAATRRTFRQFIVRRIEALGDGRIRAIGSDLREDWQRTVRAEINVPAGDGTAWREGQPVSAQAAVERLFISAGLSAADAPQLPASAQPPVNVRAYGKLGAAVEAMLAGIGLTLSVDDDGATVVAAPGDAEFEPTRLIEIRASVPERPAGLTVVGGSALQLAELTDWEPVLPDDDGTIQSLADVLDAWGIDSAAARQACLSDGGFESLLPATAPNGTTRLASLKRYAFRFFRSTTGKLPWLPVGGINDDGTFRPPELESLTARQKGTAPAHPFDSTIEETMATPIEGFELDADAGLVYLPRPPFALSTPTGGADDPTLQDRKLAGDAHLTLRIAHTAEHPPFTHQIPTGGKAQPITIHAGHLLAVYNKSGTLLNRATLQTAAQELAERLLQEKFQRVATVAGLTAKLAIGCCERVVIEAGSAGLISTLTEQPSLPSDSPFPAHAGNARSHSSAPSPSGLHQPINAFRAGPLVLRAEGETPEGESVLAVEALHRNNDTGALELRHPGAMSFPFFLESGETAKFGRWFFVAGVEVADSGRLRVLAPDERHKEFAADQLFEARHALPPAMRGLIVSLGNEPQFIDLGPLVSHSRGADPGASSSLVYDLQGGRISEHTRGGLQFLSVLALSPAHKQEGTRDGGWVPALNLREGDTGNPEVLGRGLFAESDGRVLGRLTATQQGGPVLADADTCIKHLYGKAGDDDGLYRESAGHVSTDAFFKIPGDPVHDAPIKFYAQEFNGSVPPWPPYEAQLKYDPTEQHPWNHNQREGRWKIQYRVPFLPEVPPTWKPPIGPPPVPPTDDPPAITVPRAAYARDDIRPAISDHNLWSPSLDWLAAPSNRDMEVAQKARDEYVEALKDGDGDRVQAALVALQAAEDERRSRELRFEQTQKAFDTAKSELDRAKREDNYIEGVLGLIMGGLLGGGGGFLTGRKKKS